MIFAEDPEGSGGAATESVGCASGLSWSLSGYVTLFARQQLLPRLRLRALAPDSGFGLLGFGEVILTELDITFSTFTAACSCVSKSRLSAFTRYWRSPL